MDTTIMDAFKELKHVNDTPAGNKLWQKPKPVEQPKPQQEGKK